MQTSINSSEMHFLSEQFVNKQIKHLLGGKSSNPAKSSSYKNFVLMIPFLIKKKYYRNEFFCRRNLRSFHSFLYLMKKKIKIFYNDFRCTRSDDTFYQKEAHIKILLL